MDSLRLISGQKSELTALQKQNANLQSANARPHRRSTSPGQTPPSPSANVTDLQAQLDSRTTAIESMELEISNLRAELSNSSTASSSHSEQVSALQAKLDRAERAAGAAQRDLVEARKGVDRASERAVAEGTARTSAETAQRAATREAEEAARRADEATKKADTLEKKLGALTTLHREADARRKDGEKAEREAVELRRRNETLTKENARMRAERTRAGRGGGQDDDAMDELEEEERVRLETRVRELESQLSEVRNGAWIERRREMEVEEEGFDEVDLKAEGPPKGRRMSSRHGRSGGGGLAGALASGFGALTGAADPGERRESLSGLMDDDDDFDENAFRAAREDEAKKRVERMKELKRGLEKWKGYRMDLVDVRQNFGGGLGEIFEI